MNANAATSRIDSRPDFSPCPHRDRLARCRTCQTSAQTPWRRSSRPWRSDLVRIIGGSGEMVDWLPELVGVFLGAVLGTLFGSAADRWQSRREANARRAVLFRTLSDQLNMIPAEVPVVDASALLTRSTIHVSAAAQLLQGDILDARKDAVLIKRLIIWQAFQTSHNELTRITNQAIVAMLLPPKHQAAWGQSLNVSVGLLRASRRDVLDVIPPKYRTPSWESAQSGAVKDEGLLFTTPVHPPDG